MSNIVEEIKRRDGEFLEKIKNELPTRCHIPPKPLDVEKYLEKGQRNADGFSQSAEGALNLDNNYQKP